MAVQQNKPTRSKRGMRRSHDALTAVTSLSVDKTSGETHLRHHVTADGFYRGRKVITKESRASVIKLSEDFPVKTGIYRYLDSSNPGVRCHGGRFWPFRDSACSFAGTEL